MKIELTNKHFYRPPLARMFLLTILFPAAITRDIARLVHISKQALFIADCLESLPLLHSSL